MLICHTVYNYDKPLCVSLVLNSCRTGQERNFCLQDSFFFSFLNWVLFLFQDFFKCSDYKSNSYSFVEKWRVKNYQVESSSYSCRLPLPRFLTHKQGNIGRDSDTVPTISYSSTITNVFPSVVCIWRVG